MDVENYNAKTIVLVAVYIMDVGMYGPAEIVYKKYTFTVIIIISNSFKIQ